MHGYTVKIWMHACKNGGMNVCMDACKQEWMDGCMQTRKDGWMHVGLKYVIGIMG